MKWLIIVSLIFNAFTAVFNPHIEWRALSVFMLSFQAFVGMIETNFFKTSKDESHEVVLYPWSSLQCGYAIRKCSRGNEGF